jgi:hypothetical protein
MYRWKEAGEKRWREILDAYFMRKIQGEDYVKKTTELMKEYEMKIEFTKEDDFQIFPKG